MISKIIKRNGEIVDFRPGKIQDAIAKAVQAVGGSDLETPKLLTRLIVKEIEKKYDKEVMVSVDKTISEYLNQQDWRVNANSNQGYSLGGLILNTSGEVTANYWLSHVYPAH